MAKKAKKDQIVGITDEVRKSFDNYVSYFSEYKQNSQEFALVFVDSFMSWREGMTEAQREKANQLAFIRIFVPDLPSTAAEYTKVTAYNAARYLFRVGFAVRKAEAQEALEKGEATPRQKNLLALSKGRSTKGKGKAKEEPVGVKIDALKLLSLCAVPEASLKAALVEMKYGEEVIAAICRDYAKVNAKKHARAKAA